MTVTNGRCIKKKKKHLCLMTYCTYEAAKYNKKEIHIHKFYDTYSDIKHLYNLY